jgi:U3 small nucleolar RNA-associated protein 25
MPKKPPTKKKGPKGKKARAAAKLERRWGECVDEEELQNSRIRNGKRRLVGGPSRIRSKPRKIKHGSVMTQEDPDIQHGIGNESDSSDDESDASSVETNVDSAMKSLLHGIKIPKSKVSRRENTQLATSVHLAKEEESESENSTDYHSSQEESSDESELMDNEELKLQATGENPFHSHFSKDPLSEEEWSLSDPTKKTTTDHINDSLVLQSSCRMLNNDNAFSHVHKTLLINWRRMNSKVLRKNPDKRQNGKSEALLSSLQSNIYPAMAQYSDVLFTAMQKENKDGIDNLLALHVLNHALTSSGLVTTHNNQIRHLKKREDSGGEPFEDSENWRDQGYSRPKVLVLLPTRSIACKFVKLMMKLLQGKSIVVNEERFEAEFGDVEEEDDVEEEQDEKEIRRRQVLKEKGVEWSEMFGDRVNDDDDFKLGIAFTNKKESNGSKKKKSSHDVAIKLFSDFYHSDIIVASPLGLKMSGSREDEEGDESIDTDFLSSIEIAIAHHSDFMYMQNWDHVNSVMGFLNQLPKKTSNTDFSRVRNYLLSGQAAHWRQLILISEFSDPHISSTFKRYAKSIEGQVKIRRKVPSDEASICNVLASVRQVFQRIPCDLFASQGDSRLKYFRESLLPQLLKAEQKHTLIYIPSYFDFVAVRNVLLKLKASFVSVTEYARISEISRGRARFLQGRKNIMIYTGRAHFFMRHKIKGAKHLIMFGLPEHAEFYPNLVNNLSGGSYMNVETPSSCLNLFTKYDAHCLERIVGTKNSSHMVNGSKSTYYFNS